jgi:hypothetical protein
VSAWYTAKQIADAVDGAIRATRATVLAEERERVARAIFLYANTTAREEVAEAIYALLPHLYENADREAVDHAAQ